MRILPLLALALGLVPLPAAKTLDSYFIELESGQTALLVTHYHTGTATWSRKLTSPVFGGRPIQPALARRGSFTAENSRNGFRKAHSQA